MNKTKLNKAFELNIFLLNTLMINKRKKWKWKENLKFRGNRKKINKFLEEKVKSYLLKRHHYFYFLKQRKKKKNILWNCLNHIVSVPTPLNWISSKITFPLLPSPFLPLPPTQTKNRLFLFPSGNPEPIPQTHSRSFGFIPVSHWKFSLNFCLIIKKIIIKGRSGRRKIGDRFK